MSNKYLDFALKEIVNHEVNDVLDKIRTEIDGYCSDNRDRNDGLYIAMKIIDKYRESKDADSN